MSAHRRPCDYLWVSLLPNFHQSLSDYFSSPQPKWSSPLKTEEPCLGRDRGESHFMKQTYKTSKTQWTGAMVNTKTMSKSNIDRIRERTKRKGSVGFVAPKQSYFWDNKWNHFMNFLNVEKRSYFGWVFGSLQRCPYRYSIAVALRQKESVWGEIFW